MLTYIFPDRWDSGVSLKYTVWIIQDHAENYGPMHRLTEVTLCACDT